MISLARTLYALATEHRPPPQAPVEPMHHGPSKPLPVGVPFTTVCWNLQFCGSRRHHFFYDGGRAVSVPAAEEAETRDAIGAALHTLAPALCLLQEVDRGADRTGRVDQLPCLVSGSRSTSSVTAPYHQSAYVPSPRWAPMGRVDLHLALLARAPLSACIRTQLARKSSSRLVPAFDLKRCLLTAEVPLEDGRVFQVATTHLSAFSYGDGTRARQIDTVEAWMASRPAGVPWMLGGDFNLLPPGDDPGRLGADAHLYRDSRNPLERLVPRFREAAGTGRLVSAAVRTYLPFSAKEPDRKLDYVFVGGPVEVVNHRVEPLSLSDHRPLVTTLRVR